MGALEQATASMEEARVELQNIRAEAFERLAGGRGGGVMGEYEAAPPAYTETTGTMGAYEQQPGYSKV